jgi:hypothetical protein
MINTFPKRHHLYAEAIKADSSDIKLESALLNGIRLVNEPYSQSRSALS